MKNILVIDDNEDILYTLNEILKFKQWNPFLANNVEKGLNIFKAEGIDLVIIDYHMPIVNGMTGLKKIRELSEEVPVIVLTVEENQEIADAFIEAGASDFALKPIKAPDLLSRIAVHLSRIPVRKRKYTYEKGISPTTFQIIEDYIKLGHANMTISKISKETELAYQTVHRYLQYMVREKIIIMEQVYGKIGRPKQYYKWNER